MTPRDSVVRLMRGWAYALTGSDRRGLPVTAPQPAITSRQNHRVEPTAEAQAAEELVCGPGRAAGGHAHGPDQLARRRGRRVSC